MLLVGTVLVCDTALVTTVELVTMFVALTMTLTVTSNPLVVARFVTLKSNEAKPKNVFVGVTWPCGRPFPTSRCRWWHW